ncbi:hypothetical protein QBC39DRAFT_344806 [Podospora conica]|nr:hypothetical protein QBC39DRAFT_344806 [Schizothecium conicum]
MANTSYSFIYGGTTSPSATRQATERIFSQPVDRNHATLVSILSVAQGAGVNFLPLTWFQAQEEAGIGGQAELYQYSITPGAGLAFKSLKIWMQEWPDDGDDDARRWMGVSAFIKEMTVLSQPLVSRTPHVLKLQGLAWTADIGFNGYPILVYELGVPLRRYLTARHNGKIPLTLEYKLSLCTCLCLGLSALHQSGIVHADVKPDNVIMRRRNWPGQVSSDMDDKMVPTISDLGGSIMGADADEHRLPFSYGWMAPEWHERFFQLQSARRMDVFSFGLVVYWILAWDAKFSAMSALEEADEMARLRNPDTCGGDLARRGALGLLQDLEMSNEQRSDLTEFFEKSLAADPQMRAPNAQHLLPLLGVEDHSSTPASGLPSLPTMVDHSLCSFRLVDWIEQLSLADFRVREHVFEELKKLLGTSSCPACLRNGSMQAAICSELGFGTVFDVAQRDLFLADGNWNHEEYLAALDTFLQPPPRSLPLELQYRFQPDHIHQYQLLQQIPKACEHLTREIQARSNALGNGHALVVALKPMLVSVLEAAGKREEALTLQIELYGHLNSTLGNEHPETIAAMSQLAMLYHCGGHRNKALVTGRDAYRLCRESLPANAITTMAATANLAMYLYANQRYAEACEMGQRATQQYELALGTNHPDTIKCYINEGVYSGKSITGGERTVGRLLAGIRRLRESVGFFHTDSLWALNAFADTLEKTLATPDEVLETRQTIYDHAKLLLGDDHHETWAFAAKVASTVGSSGDWDKARGLFKEALSNLNRLLGPDSSAAIEATIDFAQRLQEQGHHSETYELLEGVVLSSEGGIDAGQGAYRVMMDCMWAMGKALDAQHRAREAKPIWEKIATLAEKKEPNSMLSTQDIREAKSHLASIYIGEGNRDDGGRILGELLQWTTENLGQDATETMNYENTLASLMIDDGRCQDALEILIGLWERVARLSLSTTRETPRAIAITLMRAYGMAGRTDEAITLAEDCLPKLRSTMGDSHDDVLIIQNNLSVYYIESGLLEKAEPILSRLNEIYQRRGHEHMCLITMSNLSAIYMKTGRLNNAIETQRRIMERRERFSGGDTESYMDDAIDTAKMLLENSDSLDEAEQWAGMAWAYFRGRPQSARLAVSAGMALGNILRKRGDPMGARETFEGVLAVARAADADNSKRWIEEAEKELSEFAVDEVTDGIRGL